VIAADQNPTPAGSNNAFSMIAFFATLRLSVLVNYKALLRIGLGSQWFEEALFARVSSISKFASGGKCSKSISSGKLNQRFIFFKEHL
jgi:hypothetical protein